MQDLNRRRSVLKRAPGLRAASSSCVGMSQAHPPFWYTTGCEGIEAYPAILWLALQSGGGEHKALEAK